MRVSIWTALVVVIADFLAVTAEVKQPNLPLAALNSGFEDVAFYSSLPPLQSHSLPPTLAQWKDQTNSGNYFFEVKPTSVGYLVWSKFPVKVYIEQLPALSSTDQNQKWVTGVLQAVQEWSVYLPLKVVQQSQTADISIMAAAPRLRSSSSQNISRVRSAETYYELYISKASANHQILSHRCIIYLNPSQTDEYIRASARHELGHALGIWGHSAVETDTLYFSQVRYPPPISPRDINTLKRVYQQQTRLGWSLQAN